MSGRSCHWQVLCIISRFEIDAMGENNLEKKLTINDIAQMSGVAKSTVSRYLNGGSVKDATAQKIKKIIEENNYEPNLFARMNAKESRIIGLTVPGLNSVTTPRLVEVSLPILRKMIIHLLSCIRKMISKKKYAVSNG